MPDPSPSPVTDPAPSGPTLTAYDRSHLPTYLRLIDAADAGAAWEEATRVVLGIDVSANPEAARRIHDTHLARARWVSAHGYRQVLHPAG